MPCIKKSMSIKEKGKTQLVTMHEFLEIKCINPTLFMDLQYDNHFEYNTCCFINLKPYYSDLFIVYSQ